MLLSLIFICQPSDLAPKAQLFYPADSSTSNMYLSVDQVFLPDSNDSITIKFLGIKNDRDRLGFEVSVDLDDAFKKHGKINPVLACAHTSHRMKHFVTCRNNHSSYHLTHHIELSQLEVWPLYLRMPFLGQVLVDKGSWLSPFDQPEQPMLSRIAILTL